MNSSRQITLSTLARDVAPQKADDFLAQLLNLRDEEPAVRRFRRQFSDLLPPHVSALQEAAVEATGNERTGIMSLVLYQREMLKAAWVKPTALEREVAVLGVIYQYSRMKEANTLVLDHFLLVLLRAMHVADRMRYCPAENCAAPFFLAARRSQKYCTEECARPAQRQFKKNWWNEHGHEWREESQKRKQAQKKSRKGAHQ